LVMILGNILSLLMKILMRNNFLNDLKFTHYAVVVMDCVAGGGYLLLSNIDNL
jgi:hypothetical protein